VFTQRIIPLQFEFFPSDHNVIGIAIPTGSWHPNVSVVVLFSSAAYTSRGSQGVMPECFDDFFIFIPSLSELACASQA